mgnify:CR=1 FL=1
MPAHNEHYILWTIGNTKHWTIVNDEKAMQRCVEHLKRQAVKNIRVFNTEPFRP